MVDILQVLEGATYAAFIVGAIVAVYELRDIKKDRRIELLTRMMEHGATREFQDAMSRIWRTSATDAQQLEKEVPATDLYMLGEFWSLTSFLATSGLIEREDLLNYMDYETFWKKMGPWIIAERVATGGGLWGDIEELARLQAAGVRA